MLFSRLFKTSLDFYSNKSVKIYHIVFSGPNSRVVEASTQESILKF